MVPKDRVRVFIYRSERLERLVQSGTEGPPITVTEQGKRDWRVAEGDFLLFTAGHGLDLRFVAYSEVIGVRRRQSEEADATQTIVTATIQRPVSLPDGLSLARFMFSLTAVSNFGRPWLHLRHRVRISARDFDTLQRSRIARDRSVFFGLLRDLPPRWREFLEHESRALSARNDQRFLLRSAASSAEPVGELMALVESTLVSTSRLAADVQVAWGEIFGAESLPTIQVVEPDSSAEEWSIANLLMGASRRNEALERSWGGLSEVTSEDVTSEDVAEGGFGPWRPHRW
jgi:hypothetical protein